MMIIDVSDHFEYNFSRDVVLDGSMFRLIFNYNELYDFWTMELQDAQFNSLWIGKLVCNFDLFRRYKFDGMPAGRIIAETADKNKDVVQKSDFQSKGVVLRYIEASELNLL